MPRPPCGGASILRRPSAEMSGQCGSPSGFRVFERTDRAPPCRRRSSGCGCRRSCQSRRPGRRAVPPAASSAASCSCATLTTTRDADSPKSAASRTARPGRARVAAATSTSTPDAACVEGALRERDGEAAVGAVVRRLHQTRCRARRDEADERAFALEIERRRLALHEAVHDFQVLAAAELAEGRRRAARSRRRPP